MIRPLRRAHAVASVMLLVVATALVVAAVVTRVPWPAPQHAEGARR